MPVETNEKWMDCLRSGSRVIVKSNYENARLDTVQATSKVAVFVAGKCYRRDDSQGGQFVSSDHPKSWLIEATDARVEAIETAKEENSRAAWNALGMILSAAMPNPTGAAAPRDWPVLAESGEPFPDRLKEPLFWEEPQSIRLHNTSGAELFTDLFDARVPDAFICQVYAIMALCPHHHFHIDIQNMDRLTRFMEDETDDLDVSNSSILGIGIAAANMLDGDWIWNEGKQFRRAIEGVIALAHDFEPPFDENEYLATRELLPLHNVTYSLVVEESAEAN